MRKKGGNNKKRVPIDETSKKAFKITSDVKTSALQTIRELRAGLNVKVS